MDDKGKETQPTTLPLLLWSTPAPVAPSPWRVPMAVIIRWSTSLRVFNILYIYIYIYNIYIYIFIIYIYILYIICTYIYTYTPGAVFRILQHIIWISRKIRTRFVQPFWEGCHILFNTVWLLFGVANSRCRFEIGQIWWKTQPGHTEPGPEPNCYLNLEAIHLLASSWYGKQM